MLVELHGVGKDYPRLQPRGGRLRLVYELLRGHAPPSTFRALDDVSLSMRRGESVGVVGENGAGKSTFLKIIAGVVKPTRGTVAVNGRIAALLELGSGFHPEYTGYANIDLAAALLGMSPEEIAQHREAIVEFADIGDHIHDPIKTYSSGMVVRLGFAIATALDPDVLITDEVFAVGDESFQKKCIGWMERYLAGGGTLLLCSHSMYHVQKLCAKALWLDHGRARLFADASTVAREYLAYHEKKMSQHRVHAQVAAGEYLITSLTMTPRGSLAEVDAEQGFDATIEIRSPDARAPVVAIGVVRADGTPVYGTTSEVDGARPARIAHDRFLFHVSFAGLPLLPGHYQLRAHASDPEGMRIFDHHERPFVIGGATRELGFCRLAHAWTTPEKLEEVRR
ncbi:MAG TPA: ABC transporter ATP-binding protein [Casimicrobiaceae bacterium]|nr:ABC transporter ATP-binding protein [Casimicrobiaceae bacterium]